MKHSSVILLLLALLSLTTFSLVSPTTHHKRTTTKILNHKKTPTTTKKNGVMFDDGAIVTRFDHNVTYIHQLFDTDDSFCGNWACGPTSTVMALAHYKRIEPRPIRVTKLFDHVSPFGFYISQPWVSPTTGFVFDRVQADACGRDSQGAYGHGTDDGLAWAWRLQEILHYNGLNNKFYDRASVDVVTYALSRGRLVIMSTRLTKGGHLVLAKGYEVDAQDNIQFIVNDPYGDRNDPESYGKKHNGADVRYTWELLQGDLSLPAKWMIEVLP